MPETGPIETPMDPTPKDSSGLVLGVIAMVLLVVGGGWLYLSFGKSQTPAPVVQSPAAPAPLEVPDEIDPRFDLDQNLDMGQLALDAGQLVEPPDGSALYFFLSAREQAPNNMVADAGLARIASEMVTRADTHLVGEEYLALEDAMRVIERIDPVHPELTRLREDIAAVIEQKLAAADGAVRRGQWVPAQALYDQLALVPGIDELMLIEREDALVAAQEAAATAAEEEAAAQAAEAEAQAAAADESPAATTEETPAAEDTATEAADPPVDALFATVIQRLDEDQLLSPVGQSARDAFNELARAAPDDPTVNAARRRLVGALADRAVLLGNDDQFVEASRFLDAAELLDANNPRVNSSRDAVIDRQANLEGQRIIPVGELVNTRVVRPRYPSRALRNDAEGYVVLNFTVQSDGSTANIEAVEVSERYSEQFERAAISAVTQWQFEPRQYLGRTIDQRVQARVAFEIEP